MVYIFMGGPATGKGTRSDILAKHLNIPHISTGDMLREAAKSDKKIAEKLSKGMLISDEDITNMLKHRIKQEDCKNGFILDGYPRTITQVHELDKMLKEEGKEVTKVFELVVEDELAFRRILERKKCEKCGKAYGIDFPSKVENICDDCGGNLIIRTDDTKETLKARIDTYKKNSEEIIKYYKNAGLLKTVDASNHPERVILDI